jgi:mannose-6-phosphate isomerase-like protein (cupin superfamily)
MKIVNRRYANPIKTRHGSELRPLIDRTTSDVTQCSLAEELLPPGRAVIPHHHRQLEEIYYILEGSGRMTVGEEQRDVGAGDAIFVPRGSLHSLANTGSVPIRLLVACGPAFYYEDEIFERQAPE